jgi:hypothetical protein
MKTYFSGKSAKNIASGLVIRGFLTLLAVLVLPGLDLGRKCVARGCTGQTFSGVERRIATSAPKTIEIAQRNTFPTPKAQVFPAGADASQDRATGMAGALSHPLTVFGGPHFCNGGSGCWLIFAFTQDMRDGMSSNWAGSEILKQFYRAGSDIEDTCKFQSADHGSNAAMDACGWQVRSKA